MLAGKLPRFRHVRFMLSLSVCAAFFCATWLIEITAGSMLPRYPWVIVLNAAIEEISKYLCVATLLTHFRKNVATNNARFCTCYLVSMFSASVEVVEYGMAGGSTPLQFVLNLWRVPFHETLTMMPFMVAQGTLRLPMLVISIILHVFYNLSGYFNLQTTPSGAIMMGAFISLQVMMYTYLTAGIVQRKLGPAYASILSVFISLTFLLAWADALSLCILVAGLEGCCLVFRDGVRLVRRSVMES